VRLWEGAGGAAWWRREVKRALLAAAMAALAGLSWAQKPTLAVLPYQAEGGSHYGPDTRRALEEKLARTFQYELTQSMDVDGAMAATGFALTPDTPPAAVAGFVRDRLQARLALWGFARRGEPKGWVFEFRFMDLEESEDSLLWSEEKHITQYRELPLLLTDIVEKVSGFRRRIGEDPQVPENQRIPNPPNLLPNGDFEQGDATPLRWERVNNLTTFYDAAGFPGKCLLIDTDVLESQVLNWHKALAQGADFQRPPRKLPTKPPKYDTIGGTYGVHFRSDPVPVKRGMVYRLNVDVQGGSKPKIFVKGYAPFGATEFGAQDREIYNMYLSCETVTNGRQFDRHTRTFMPNPYYVAFDLEDAGVGELTAVATETLREVMAERGFPQIPREQRMAILGKSGFKARLNTPIPELLVHVRDHLVCGHGVYGKVEKTDQGPQLCLRLMSARIKQNVPLVDMAFPVTDKASVAKACGQFLDACEARMPFVVYVRVIPYGYWAPGLYRFDNVTMTEEGTGLW